MLVQSTHARNDFGPSKSEEKIIMAMARRAALRIALSIAGPALVAGIMSLAPAAAAQVVDHLGLPGPIQFGGKAFSLAWSSKPRADYIKQEYLPAGQQPQSYRQMLLVERVAGSLKVMDAVRVQAQMLQNRKATDPLVNMGLIQNQASGEALLDFIVSSKDPAGNLVIEWNAYRYAPAPAGRPGVMLFGASHRAYGAENAEAFLTQLKTLRPAQISALTKAPLPKLR
jgi:hypothetical protein